MIIERRGYSIMLGFGSDMGGVLICQYYRQCPDCRT